MYDLNAMVYYAVIRVNGSVQYICCNGNRGIAYEIANPRKGTVIVRPFDWKPERGWIYPIPA